MPIVVDALNNAVGRAIEFLRREQMPHGEFKTLLAADKSMSNAVLDSSPFVTSFVIYALAHAADFHVTEMIAKAAAFLRSEMEFGGVWRYWSSRQHKHARLPPDLDDSACISYALKLAGEYVPNNLWAFRAARDAAGRFRTWLPPPGRGRLNPRFLVFRSIGFAEAQRRARRIPAPAHEDARFRVMHIDAEDVDPVVNANVVLYLGERTETEAAIEFIVETIRQARHPFSLYYDEPLTLYYAVARAFRHASPRLSVLREQIRDKILSRSEEIARTPLQAALAASALLTFDRGSDVIAQLTATILESQRGEGGWDACPFYSVWGSRELTTAFCIEVLARVRSLEGRGKDIRLAG